MLPEEHNAIQHVLSQAAQVPAQMPDPQADMMIRQSIGGRPDALYLLTQMLAFKEVQLQNAQQTMLQMQQHIQMLQTQLQAQAQPAPRSLFGFGTRPAPMMQPPPVMQQPPMMHAPAPFGPAGMTGRAGGGFLGDVATTAVGVVAGQAAFSALGSLFGGGHHGAGSGAAPAAPTETVVNNYYDSPDSESSEDEEY